MRSASRHKARDDKARALSEDTANRGWRFIPLKGASTQRQEPCEAGGAAGAYSRFSTWSTRRRAQLDARNERFSSSGS